MGNRTSIIGSANPDSAPLAPSADSGVSRIPASRPASSAISMKGSGAIKDIQLEGWPPLRGMSPARCVPSMCALMVSGFSVEELVQRQEYLDTTNAEKYSEYF